MGNCNDTNTNIMTKEQKIDFEKLYSEVCEDLKNLNKNLLYHGINHTIVDVLPNSIKLGKKAKLSEEKLLILKTAALFHDTGFLDQYDKNEPMGAKRARNKCEKYGYTNDQIKQIEKAILATQLPQNPGDDLISQLMCDSDLGHIGNDGGSVFFLRTECLRMELRLMKNLNVSPRKFHEGNLNFLAEHKYFSNEAKELYEDGKKDVIKSTKELLGLKE